MNDGTTKVEPQKPGLASSPILDEREATTDLSTCRVCYWNGVAWSEHARVCSTDGKLMECRNVNGTMRWVVRGRC